MRDPVYRFRGHQRPTAESRTVILPTVNELPATSADGAVATMRLYDPIDDWGEFFGTSSGEFAEALDQVPDSVTEIQLHINSPGGVIYEGIAILSQLRQWAVDGRRVVAIVDGVAASIASLIAIGVNETVMNPDSMLMVHDGSGICGGTAADMHAAGDALDLQSDIIAGVYARKAGGTAEEWRARMIAKGIYGQWFTAQEALDIGLIDRITDTPALDEPVEQATARATTHRAALSAVTSAAHTPAAPPSNLLPTDDDQSDAADAAADAAAAEALQAAAAMADADRHRHAMLLAGV